MEEENSSELEITGGFGNWGVPVSALDDGEFVLSILEWVVDVKVGVVENVESLDLLFFLEVIEFGAELKLGANELMVEGRLLVIGLELFG